MTLSDFLETDYWQVWDSGNRSPASPRMILADPERFDRIYKAAEHGSDGSTTAEVIEDWRQALSCAVQDEFLTEEDRAAIEQEIDSVEDWHEQHGTLDEAIG